MTAAQALAAIPEPPEDDPDALTHIVEALRAADQVQAVTA